MPALTLSYRLEDERERRSQAIEQLALTPDGVFFRTAGLSTWGYALRWDGRARRHRLPRIGGPDSLACFRAVQIDGDVLSLSLLDDLNSEFRPRASSQLTG